LDREWLAQGVGNVVSGFLGALPVTGVIVRSSANVEAGARTRLPAMGHAVMIAVVVLLLPWTLTAIPTAALAAVLVHTGLKLLAPAKLSRFWRNDRAEAVVFALTATVVVAVGLLEGVVLGLAVAGLVRLVRSHDLHITAHKDDEQQHVDLHLSGAATFLTTPRLQTALASIPEHYSIHFSLDDLHQVDDTAQELIRKQIDLRLTA